MSLASTLALVRPTLPSYVNLTKYGLIECRRDNFNLNLNPNPNLNLNLNITPNNKTTNIYNS